MDATTEMVPVNRESKTTNVKIRRDPDFNTGAHKLPLKSVDEVARIITWGITDDHAESDRQTQDLSVFHTFTMGRMGYIRPFKFAVDGDEYGCVVVKGLGAPEGGTSSAMSAEEDFKEPEAPFVLIKKGGEIGGASTRKDQSKDAKKSIAIRKKYGDRGVLVRAPIAGYWPDVQVLYEGELMNVSELKAKRLISEEKTPYMSVWGMKTPYRIEDLNLAITTKDEDKLRSFLNEAVKFSDDKTKEQVKGFIKDNDYSSAVSTLLQVSVTRIDNTLTLFKQDNASHGTLHMQNISLEGELCDNSTVQLTFGDPDGDRREFEQDLRKILADYEEGFGEEIEVDYQFSKDNQVISSGK